jgi:hypothetical protein
LIVNVPCQHSTVAAAKPQISPNQPPTRNITTASATTTTIQ